MAQPLRNPFYGLLLVACGLLLVTMLVYLLGWYCVPDPYSPRPAITMPPPMQWVDRHALVLIAGEVVAIIVLGGLTVGLDRFFEPGPAKSGRARSRPRKTESADESP